MFGLFGKKKAKPRNVTIVARLNDRIMPIDRGERYEDPLSERLQKLGLGEVTGGGTSLSERNEIEFCDIEISVHAVTDSTLDMIRTALEEFGAPKGSKLLLTEGDTPREIAFGTIEGVGVYLNGTDLADDVYRDCDVNFVIDEFVRLVGDDVFIAGTWEGPTETAIYLNGISGDVIQSRLAEFIATYPLCQRARVVRIA